jgi:thiol-disulfide isomerase/thioredoxin
MKAMVCCFVVLTLVPASLAQITIRGTVTGVDGRPPLLSHVHIGEPAEYGYEGLRTAEVRPDGMFEVTVGQPGFYTVLITAANHAEHRLFVFAREKDVIRLDVQLAPYKLLDVISPKIIGDWSEFRRASAEPFLKQQDGTYLYERTAPADTVSYQIIGVEKSNRSINGTMADYFRYDGSGDYRSVVRVKDGKVRIVFDPAKMLRSVRADLPLVVFDKDHAYLSRLTTLRNKVSETVFAYAAARKKLHDTGGNADTLQFDFLPTVKDLLSTMQDAHEVAELRQFAALKLLSLAPFSQKAVVTDKEVEEAVRLLPVSSAIWGLDHYLIFFAAKLLVRLEHGLPLLPQGRGETEDERDVNAKLQEFADANPVKTVRAVALSSLVWIAARDNSPDFVTLYSALKEKYGELTEIQYTLSELDPASPVAPGKPVPAFQLTLMESGETVSHQTMRGKYYLMDFWAVWCAPCVAEMPTLHQAYEKFKDRNFTILSLSFDSRPQDVEEFRKKKWKMPWLHAFVEGGFDSDIAKAFRVSGIPKPILVGPDGTILSVFRLRGEDLTKTLAQYLPARKMD